MRRFVCESLSFTHRYIPVGLLERLPVQLNERAFPYKGRDELEVRCVVSFFLSRECAEPSRADTLRRQTDPPRE